MPIADSAFLIAGLDLSRFKVVEAMIVVASASLQVSTGVVASALITASSVTASVAPTAVDTAS